jgi:ferritin-like metal-binding protein YciE
MSMDSLTDLYVEQLQDLYSAENQILKALPDMEKAAQHHQLKDAFREHRKVTEEQVKRLEQIFDDLGESPKGHHCKGMEGLIKEGQEMLGEKGDSNVIDAGLIAAAQRVEHYEIAGYGTVRSYAERLGHSNHVDLLQRTLDEEGETDKKLTQLAEGVINQDAMR